MADPNRVLNSQIPFTQFRSRVKCLRCDGWNEVQRAAFSLAFPGFFAEEHPNPQTVQQLDPMCASASGNEQPFRYRRFSGGASLSRSRYYSVCETDSGQDSQTLAQELMAYSEWGGELRLFALDLDDPNQDGPWKDFETHWNIPCPTHQLAVVFQWDTPVPPTELQFFPFSKLPNGFNYFPVLYPTTLTELSLPQTIDLRLPRTQDWLASSIVAGLPDVMYGVGDKLYRGLPLQDGTDQEWPIEKPFVSRRGLDCFSYPPRPDWDRRSQPITPDFYGILPLLMFPGRGGSPLTEAIGRWVRSIGADAFVYPSARANVRCKIEDGKLTESWGWDLVDYRGSGRVDERAMIIWEPHSWAGMWGQLGVNEPKGRLAGTFFVDGNVEAHRKLVARHLLP